MHEKTKTVLVLRGLSGSGKSTLSRLMAQSTPNSIICEADDYFTNKETGEYQFDGTKIHLAHKACREKFAEAIKNGVELIICSNTNIRKRDYRPYVELAREAGYIVHILKICDVTVDECLARGKHGVSREKLEEWERILKENE